MEPACKYTTFMEKLLDLMEVHQSEFNPAQMATMLAETAASIAFSCAPDEGQAFKILVESIKHSHKIWKGENGNNQL